MNIAIIGLGLIGGSIAKALENNHKIFCYDIDNTLVDNLTQVNENFFRLDMGNTTGIDYVFIAIPPLATIEFLKNYSDKFVNAYFCDICGIKAGIESVVKDLNINYIGLHPMAGKEVGGFKNSDANLFKNASLIITSENIPATFLELVTDLKFGKVVHSSALEHDEIIAYTSQLPHIVSNAFVKSKTAKKSKGFSGGSFEDLTRVGRLDAKLWTELFMQNSENVLNELDVLIENLSQYRHAIKNKNEKQLFQLLTYGSKLADNLK